MIQRIAKRLRDEDKGFTLIELMVVVLIIGILIAIAIPTFLGARARAQDRAAQSSARNAVTAAKALYTDDEDYADADETTLDDAEPSLTFVGTAVASGDDNEVSVDSVVTGPATKAQEFYSAVMSDSGTCWYIRDSVIPGANGGTGWAKDTTTPTCTATAAIAILDGVYGLADTPGEAA